MYAKTTTMLISAMMLMTVAEDARAAAKVEKDKFKGVQVATQFSIDASVTCADGSEGNVSAGGFVAGSETITKQTGSPKTVSNGVFLEIDSYFNSCTGTSFGFGDGGIADGFAAPNRKLDSAGFEGTAVVLDFDTGAELAVSLELVVVGTGPVTSSKSTTKTKTVSCPHGAVTITINRTASANREGMASGTIGIEGFELTPTFSSTTLSDSSNTDITIQKK
jgi:hypothetical protein